MYLFALASLGDKHHLSCSNLEHSGLLGEVSKRNLTTQSHLEEEDWGLLPGARGCSGTVLASQGKVLWEGRQGESREWGRDCWSSALLFSHKLRKWDLWCLSALTPPSHP